MSVNTIEESKFINGYFTRSKKTQKHTPEKWEKIKTNTSTKPAPIKTIDQIPNTDSGITDINTTPIHHAADHLPAKIPDLPKDRENNHPKAPNTPDLSKEVVDLDRFFKPYDEAYFEQALKQPINQEDLDNFFNEDPFLPG